MNFLPPHRQDKKYDLFGFLTNRLVFGEPNKGQMGPQKKPMSEVLEAEKRGEKTRRIARMELRDSVLTYNGEFPSDKVELKGSIDKINAAELKRLSAQIEKKLKAIKHKRARETAWKADPQYIALIDLQEVVRLVEKLDSMTGVEVVKARRGRLLERYRFWEEAGERQEKWTKHKRNYEYINSIIDQEIAKSEYQETWAEIGDIPTASQQEARDLFFAIMADKTDNFKKTFVLGDRFGEDHEANIRNFPFIYNEFLKVKGGAVSGQGVDLEKLARAESEVNEADQAAAASGTTAEAIVAANTSAPIRDVPLPPEPTTPSAREWDARCRALEFIIRSLGSKASEQEGYAKKYPHVPTSPQAAWRRAAEQLQVHLLKAKAHRRLSAYQDREKSVREQFKKSRLLNQQKLLMSLAFKKFMKAYDMIKRPDKNTYWNKDFHPAVFRAMVATVYENGVAAYVENNDGQVAYNDDLRGDSTWMVANLYQTNYFNKKLEGSIMDNDQRALLKAAAISSKLVNWVKRIQQAEKLLKAWRKARIKAEQEGLKGEELKKFLKKEMSQFPWGLAKKFEGYDLDELERTIKAAKKEREKLENFIDRTQRAVRDVAPREKVKKGEVPESTVAQDLIRDMRDDKFAGELARVDSELEKLHIIDGDELREAIRMTFDVETNYMTARHEKKNMLDFFDAMGMDIKGIYKIYNLELQALPEAERQLLRAENWLNLLMGPRKNYDKLHDFLSKIIPPDRNGGKADFLAGLDSLRAKYEGDPDMTKLLAKSMEEGTEDFAVVQTLKMLQLHLKGRAVQGAISDQNAKAAEAHMNGINVGHTIGLYGQGVWNMIMSHSLTTKFAGLGIAYMGYKALRSAMKGETKFGKMSRVLLIGVLAEVGMYEITGRGLFDRMGLGGFEQAMAGTYESVLKEDAEEQFKKEEIAPEAHYAALLALNEVPFDKVMDWYNNSDNNGMPEAGKGKNFMPSKLRGALTDICKKNGMNVQDPRFNKQLEGSRILKKTVQHFFHYVLNKNKDTYASELDVQKALQAKWIDPFKSTPPKFDSKLAYHRDWVKDLRIKRNDITWRTVMVSEISDDAARKAKDKTTINKALKASEEAFEGLSEWASTHVLNPTSEYVDEFFRDMGDKAQDVKKDLEKLCEKAENKVYFGYQEIKLWYGAHEYTIKRVAKEHWDLLVTGVKMPFKIIYAVDRKSIPWILSKIDQIEASLDSNRPETINHNLQISDIAGHDEALMGSTDLKINNKFKYYGVYQPSFLEAMAPQRGATRRPNPVGQKFYKDATNTGYFIAEVDPSGVQENYIFDNDADSEHHLNNKLLTMAQAQAVKMFARKGSVNERDIEKYMDKIHVIYTTGTPRRVYVFYRMPLKGSLELAAKKSGRWVDKPHAEQIMDRPHFDLDPSNSAWENIKTSMALDMGPLRTISSTLGKYGAQVPRILFAHIAIGGSALKAISKIFRMSRQNQEAFNSAVDAVTQRDESTKKFIDELFSSAENKGLALSDYYQQEKNAKLYKFQLEYSQDKEQYPLYLGLMKNVDKAFESPYYDEPPSGKSQEDVEAAMRSYYLEYLAKGNKPDKDIEELIKWSER